MKKLLLILTLLPMLCFAQTVEIRKLTVSCDRSKIPPTFVKEIAALRVDTPITLPAAEADKRIDDMNAIYRKDPCLPGRSWKTEESSRIPAAASSSSKSSAKSSASSSKSSSSVASLASYEWNAPTTRADGTPLKEIAYYELIRADRVEKVQPTGAEIKYVTTASQPGDAPAVVTVDTGERRSELARFPQ